MDRESPGAPSVSLHPLFVGAKISKICYAGELQNKVDAYVLGTWNGRVNRVALYNVYFGRAQVKPKDYFHKPAECVVESSVNDVFTAIAVAGLDNGDVVLFSTAENKLHKLGAYANVHGTCGSTSLCIVDDELLSGSDNGSIFRMDLGGQAKPSALAMGLTSVKGDGRLRRLRVHLWDVRQVNPAISFEAPVFSKAVAPLNVQVTALDSHPGQRNVIAFGTSSGSVAFVDIRHYKQPTPSLLKVSQDPVQRVKFHPSFGDNCFALSDEFLLHLDPGAPIDEVTGRSRANVWLTASSWNLLQINSLIADRPRLSTFDCSPHSLLVGSDTGSLSLITNTHFS
ncbi:hypothetical protein M3Y99_00784100 [Aphelenchoides fujianensis]|nr:hypothetical protein M3Y99_00784100 [Aphelenchoides fujianensis]